MLTKVVEALEKFKKGLAAVKRDVLALKAVKPVAKPGKDGKDGRDAPPLEELVAAVLAQIPEPEKVEIPTKAELVAEVLAKIPKPRDGRDGQTVSVSDVAAIVLAKLPKPKDGRDAPDLETVAKQVRLMVQDGRDGATGAQGEKGEPGKDGISVTDVKVENNSLYVWLDGVKKLAGKINVSAPFNPGGGGGGGGDRIGEKAFLIRGGFFDYNDLATQSTPINVPGDLSDVDLPNDGLGAFTNKNFPPPNVTELWNAGNGVFDWAELKLGDTVDIRLDLSVTTTAPNQLVIVDLLLAIGSGGDYRINYIRDTFKTVGEKQVITFEGIYMGDLNTLNFPAKFNIRSDAAATVKVNGWYVRALLRG